MSPIASHRTLDAGGRIRLLLLIAMLSLIAPAMRPALAEEKFEFEQGTLYLEPRIITSSDPSALSASAFGMENPEPLGLQMRGVYDRREPNGLGVMDVYVFRAAYEGGSKIDFLVNPKVGTEAAVRNAAFDYAKVIGRLPEFLRRDIRTVTIHDGEGRFGGDGQTKNLLIYADSGTIYSRQGVLEETLIHEATHISMDRKYADSPGWLAAQKADGKFISKYAWENPTREDMAESMVCYLGFRYRRDRISAENAEKFEKTIPHRMAYFDSLDLVPEARVKKVRPVGNGRKIVTIRGVAPADVVRVKVNGKRATGLRPFKARLRFPLRETRMKVRVVAITAEGLRATKIVEVRRRALFHQ